MSREAKPGQRLAVPEIQRSRSARQFSICSKWSLGTSWRILLRQFIGIGHFLRVHLLGIGRVVEAEIIGRDFAPGLPVPELDAVLRPLVDVLGGDDIPAGIRMIALRDPDLPID